MPPKIKATLYLPEDILGEIQTEGARQERSLPWLAVQAWLIARSELQSSPPSSGPLFYNQKVDYHFGGEQNPNLYLTISTTPEQTKFPGEVSRKQSGAGLKAKVCLGPCDPEKALAMIEAYCLENLE